MKRAQTLAWGVHVYTMLGGVVGLLALFAAAEGRTREAFLLLIVSMLLDATDGLFARRLRVKEVLPYFDGATVDNVIDTLTFVWIPAFIMGHEGLLPHIAWTAVPVIAALYAYGQVNMKTDDGYFIGFPSYWSTVALYLYWLRPDAIIAVAMVLVFGVLSFVPTRYLYPSKGYALWRTSWALGAVWIALIVYLLTQQTPDPTLVWLSLFYPAFYMGASFWVDYRVRRGLPV